MIRNVNYVKTHASSGAPYISLGLTRATASKISSTKVGPPLPPAGASGTHQHSRLLINTPPYMASPPSPSVPPGPRPQATAVSQEMSGSARLLGTMIKSSHRTDPSTCTQVNIATPCLQPSAEFSTLLFHICLHFMALAMNDTLVWH